jgi:hypothetical protein
MLLAIGLVVAGVFSIGLGLVHLAIPRLLDVRGAVGADGPGLPPLRRLVIGDHGYQVRRRDVIGIAWVMSNAASYVLISIGAVDLAWASGWRGFSLVGGAWWIAGWWAIRSASQLTIGRRSSDLAFAGWFVGLAVLHVSVAVAGSPA